MEPRTKTLLVVAVVLVAALSAVGALMAFNKSPDLLDSEFKVIVTGSMDGDPHPEYDIETIPVNSLIAVHKLQGNDVDDVKVGDVIGFYSEKLGANIYHRVIDIDVENRVFTTKGDANDVADKPISFDEANGKVVNVSHGAGEVVHFIKSNIFLLVAIVILSVILVEVLIHISIIWKE